jgi:hypothetical protein
MGLSLRGYARHRRALGLPGGTHQAVRKAIEGGRIASGPDGIEPEVADRQWEANTWRPLTAAEVEVMIETPGALEAATDALASGLLAFNERRAAR